MHVFHVSDLPDEGGEVSVDADERRHLRSRRLRAREAVRLVDGAGGYAEATYLDGNRFRSSPKRIEPGHSPRLTLIQARLPAEKLDWAIQKSVELGVGDIIVYHPERSGLGKKRLDRADRWQRIVKESCKQSGRAKFPTVGTAASLPEAIEACGGCRFFLADQAGGELPAGLGGEPMALIVGPEGGLTEAERRTAKSAGAAPLRLSPWTLRSETVAAAGLALLQYAYGPMSSESQSEK